MASFDPSAFSWGFDVFGYDSLDAGRTLTPELELRAIAPAADDRVLLVAAEDRTLAVAED